MNDIGRYIRYFKWFKRHWTDALVWIYSGFILYTTLTPFSFVFDAREVAINLSRIEWVPYILELDFYSGSDILLNILLFFPLGLFLGARRALQVYRRFRRDDWIGILRYALLLSLTVEFVQNFTENRFSNTSDMVNNFFGAFLGALLIDRIYISYGDRIKLALISLFKGKPEMILAAFMAGAVVAAQAIPFEVEITVEKFLERLIRMLVYPGYSDGDTWASGMLLILLYSTLTYFLIRGIRLYFPGLYKPFPIFFFLFCLFIFSVGMEWLQLAIPLRRHSLVDPLFAWAGITIGASWSIWENLKLLAQDQTTTDGARSSLLANQLHQRYLTVTGCGYLVFLAGYIFSFIAANSGFSDIHESLRYFFDPVSWLRGIERTVIVIYLLQIWLVFVLLAFFLAHLLRNKVDNNRRLYIIAVTGVLVVGVTLVLSLILNTGLRPHLSHTIAALVGLRSGVMLEMFHYLMTRESSDALL